MKIKQTIEFINQQLASGIQPMVEFRKEIEEKESYAENGMRATVISIAAIPRDDEVVSIKFSYAGLENHNVPLEGRNYYGKDGIPNKTCKEAGLYTEIESMYFDLNEEADDCFVILRTDSQVLYKEYIQSGSKMGYVPWLEGLIMSTR